jgi:hypothetical protein
MNRGNVVDDPEEEQIFRDLWEDETQREVVMESLKADCEVRRGGLKGLGIIRNLEGSEYEAFYSVDPHL